ncbi:hypothetical protein G9F71_012635 [Clostridium sp. FP2]|uniref:hypothetical protein n=1 Tax=Clostridium sp. FP2 TaxID=2724481 RepID=UPI001A9AD460|nr:hypothetical protein [Clostridium sp. FP2]MBZ9623694.1 hypothetical protein [Clostridium sp. FP2]
MKYITTFILLLIGFIFGKLLLKQSNKNYDFKYSTTFYFRGFNKKVYKQPFI